MSPWTTTKTRFASRISETDQQHSKRVKHSKASRIDEASTPHPFDDHREHDRQKVITIGNDRISWPICTYLCAKEEERSAACGTPMKHSDETIPATQAMSVAIFMVSSARGSKYTA